MFKKSEHQGDKTPKQENKDHVSKTAEAANQSTPETVTKETPAKEEKKS